MENKGRSNCSLVLHIKDALNRYLLKSLESYLTSFLISLLYLFSQSFRFSFHGDPLICPIQGIQCHCLSSDPEQLQQFHLPPCLQPLPSLVSLSWRYLNQIFISLTIIHCCSSFSSVKSLLAEEKQKL